MEYGIFLLLFNGLVNTVLLVSIWIAAGEKSGVNIENVKTMILAVDEHLTNENIALPYEKKAELIVFLLEESSAEKYETTAIPEMINRLLRLIK